MSWHVFVDSLSRRIQNAWKLAVIAVVIVVLYADGLDVFAADPLD